MILSALKKFMSPKKQTPIRRPAKLPAFRVESLEDRTVPTTLTVGTGGYATISAALAAASNNATINIAPGKYNESLLISKSGITLNAEGSGVIIQPTSASSITLASSVSIGGAAIDITGSNAVVNGVTVDGSLAGSNLWFGILVDGGSATIKNNTVENIDSPSAATADAGVGIQIGTSTAEVGVTTSATAKVENNTVLQYAGAGVEVDGSQSAATIEGNTITGRNTSNNGVEYGVQVSDGSTARVQGNTISQNTLTGQAGAPSNPSPTSAGVFVFNDGGRNTVVALNCITMNDDGVLVQSSNSSGCSSSIQIVNNSISQNYGYAGIFVLSSSNVEVSCNDVSNNLTYNGIALNYSSNVLVNSNDVYFNGVSGSGTDGIYDQDGSGNQILANNSYANTGNGINIVSSSRDSLFNNVTWNNALCGIQDLDGTNDAIWLGDAVTNDSDGIYLNGTSGDTVVGNVVALNGGYGIHVVGATNTFIAANLLADNDAGAIMVTGSTGTVSIANWTINPPIKDGTSGMNGSSSSFSCALADADNLCSSLCN
jgi:parallel beta-helix repeat protein